MNNETNNNNEQLNGSSSNQPDIQNDYSNNNNQSPFGTYSAIPEIFNDRNTVSQNRSIPMQKKPNNVPPARKIKRVGSVKSENNTNNYSAINKNTNKAPSRGREFVKEFYPDSLNNVQADTPQQKEAVKTMPETNKNIDNAISTSNRNNQKRDIKYNYDALTKPNKKLTFIIILVYIIVVIMLLVGVIGFLLTSGISKTQGELTQFLENIDVESVFADEDSMSEDRQMFNDTYVDVV